MKVAVFDVCGTLYDSNTTFDFLDYYLHKNYKYIVFRKFSKSLLGKIANYPFYRFMQYDVIRLMATRFLKGVDESELKYAARIFVYQQLVRKIKPNIEELLFSYKEKGFIIILMSGSYSVIIQNVCDYFNADYYFSSELEVVNKKYTGIYKNDQLYNKKEVLLEKHPNITELIVVSDNRTDYVLMKEASIGYAVCNKSTQVSFWERKNLSNVVIIK